MNEEQTSALGYVSENYNVSDLIPLQIIGPQLPQLGDVVNFTSSFYPYLYALVAAYDTGKDLIVLQTLYPRSELSSTLAVFRVHY